MKTKYNIDYFIKKFEKIDEDNFITRSYSPIIDGMEDTSSLKHCALGHCGANTDNSVIEEHYFESEEADCLFKLVIENLGLDISNINDGIKQYVYKQSTPKQRVLAALYDIKKMQEPKIEEVKEKIVYKVVEVDSKVKSLVKEELIMN